MGNIFVIAFISPPLLHRRHFELIIEIELECRLLSPDLRVFT